MSTLATPRPSIAPPAPPRRLGRDGDGGGGPFRVPWWFWILGIVLACAWLVLAFKLVRAIPLRPLPILAALVSASGAAWLGHHRVEALSERVQGWIYASGICAGIVGEFAHYMIVGAPPFVSKSVWWLVVGAGGIGGAIGVAMGVFVSMGCAAGVMVMFLWHNRRGPAA